MNLIDFKMVTQRVLYENYFERVAQVDKSVLFIKNFTKDVTEKDITALSKDIEEVQLRTIFSKKVDNQRCAFFSGLIICISFLSGKEAHTPLGNIKTGIFCKKIGAGTHRLKLFVFIFSDEIFDLVPSIHYWYFYTFLNKCRCPVILYSPIRLYGGMNKSLPRMESTGIEYPHKTKIRHKTQNVNAKHLRCQCIVSGR